MAKSKTNPTKNSDNNWISTEQLHRNLNFLFESANVINPVTGRKYTKTDYITGFLGISVNTYDNYRTNRTSANRLSSLATVVAGANRWLAKDDGLKAWFPNGLTQNHLVEVDLVSHTLTENQISFYPRKIMGTYLCYYSETHIDVTEKRDIRYGVMQIIPSANGGGFYTCKGIFALKSFDEAQRIHTKLEDNDDALDEISPSDVFKGKAYIKRDLLWVTLSNENADEFVAISFDIDPKVLEKDPAEPFKGTRGLVLSQSSGTNSRSVAFPMAIKKTPIAPSENELRKHLAFEHKQVDDNSAAVRELTANVLGLVDSLNEMDIDSNLRFTLVSKLLSSGINAVLETSVYDSYYYSSRQNSVFYRDIIRPEEVD